MVKGWGNVVSRGLERMKLIKPSNIKKEDRGGYFRKILLDQKFRKNIKSLGLLWVKILAKRTSQRHMHKTLYEIFYFLGNGTLGVNGKKYKLKKDYVAVIEPNEAHWVRAGEKPLELIAIKIPHNREDKILT